MKSGASFALPTRALAVLLATSLMIAAVFASANAAQAKKPSGTGSLPVSGALADGGTFEGTISNFDASTNAAGDPVISGVLNGTATDAAGEVTRITDQAFTTAALQPGGACDILFLDLLGLQVDLSQITLDIDAVPGAGNLLGNLLCAITGLLDNAGNTNNAIANLLDRVFSLLG